MNKFWVKFSIIKILFYTNKKSNILVLKIQNFLVKTFSLKILREKSHLKDIKSHISYYNYNLYQTKSTI